jgi:hypothetical protein
LSSDETTTIGLVKYSVDPTRSDSMAPSIHRLGDELGRELGSKLGIPEGTMLGVPLGRPEGMKEGK